MTAIYFPFAFASTSDQDEPKLQTFRIALSLSSVRFASIASARMVFGMLYMCAEKYCGIRAPSTDCMHVSCQPCQPVHLTGKTAIGDVCLCFGYNKGFVMLYIVVSIEL